MTETSEGYRSFATALATKNIGRLGRIMKPLVVTGGMFVAVHMALWGIEYAHYRWCIQDFWMSMLTTHSSPCSALRDLSTVARSFNANLFLGAIGIANIASNWFRSSPSNKVTDV